MPSETSHVEEPTNLHDQIELRKFEAWMSFWKVVCGSMIVGVVAALLPFIVQIINSNLKEKNDYRSFVDKYINNGLKQDIEFRIRFAEYFSYISDSDSIAAWQKYHSELVKRRDKIRSEIHALERQRAQIAADANGKLSEKQQIEYQELSRKLTWKYGEVGYAPQGVSIVQANSTANQSCPGGYNPESATFLELDNIRYELHDAIRNKPVNHDLIKSISESLHGLAPGLTAVIISGGQDRPSLGTRRIGSHSHDVDCDGYSNAVDFHLMLGDKKLVPTSEEFYKDVIRTLSRKWPRIGVHQGFIHVDGESPPMIWGDGGKASNTPPWAKEAYRLGRQ